MPGTTNEIVMPTEFTPEKLKDLANRIRIGKLTPEEEQLLKDTAQAIGTSVGEVMRQFGEAMRKALPQVQATGEQMEALAKLTNTMKKVNDKPLARWTADELMAAVPRNATQQLEKISDFQLACITQHTLNNCAPRSEGTYDGALQGVYVPLLIQRLAARPIDVRATRMRTAWALYRSGGATLEEISPLLDQATEEAEPIGDPLPEMRKRGIADGLGLGWCGNVPAKQSPSCGTPRLRPARIPKAIAHVNGELVCDSIAYVVVKEGNAEHPNTMMLAELDDNNVRIPGGSFWVDVV